MLVHWWDEVCLRLTNSTTKLLENRAATAASPKWTNEPSSAGGRFGHHSPVWKNSLSVQEIFHRGYSWRGILQASRRENLETQVQADVWNTRNRNEVWRRWVWLFTSNRCRIFCGSKPRRSFLRVCLLCCTKGGHRNLGRWNRGDDRIKKHLCAWWCASKARRHASGSTKTEQRLTDMRRQ
jgi:hypothetical protein